MIIAENIIEKKVKIHITIVVLVIVKPSHESSEWPHTAVIEF